jgi:hypothetical protein
MHAKIWRQRFPEKKIAADSARRAGAALRAPVWANEEKISEKYCEALRLQQETGIRMSVDHVIPLFGELVSGLHVPENLQVIPFVENARKSNQYHVA